MGSTFSKALGELMLITAMLVFSAVLVLLAKSPQEKLNTPQVTARWSHVVAAGAAVEYKLIAREGVTVKFVALGEGIGDLNVRILDETGQEVATDQDLGNLCVAVWKAQKTQTYRVVISNPSAVPIKTSFGHNLRVDC
jgi:hypothetical protein